MVKQYVHYISKRNHSDLLLQPYIQKYLGKSRSRDPFHNQPGSGALGSFIKNLGIGALNYLKSPHGKAFVKKKALQAINSKQANKIVTNTGKYIARKILPKKTVQTKKTSKLKKKKKNSVSKKSQKGGGGVSQKGGGRVSKGKKKHQGCLKKSHKTRSLKDLY